jgi:hypothetical protein
MEQQAMNNSSNPIILVGDNPFHGISHLSQERARSRGQSNDSIDSKADVVVAAIKNGANGFSFSVSEITLAILKNIQDRDDIESVKLYPIVPYAFEYVRMATQTGTPGLARKFAKQIILSKDIGAIVGGLKAVLTMNPEALLRTYLAFEISRIKSASGKKGFLSSILLHEVITDMALALELDWLFKCYVSYLNKKGITPGFNTRNFPYLIKKFNEWKIDLDNILVETQFNRVGFQMNPSREECEKVLSKLKTPIVLAISVLAAGYLKPVEAVDYIANLKLKGVVVGVSTKEQALQMFPLLKEKL